MKDRIGVNKDIDKLGRVVIPKEMRELFKIEKEIELVITEDGVLVRNPEYKLIKKNSNNDSFSGTNEF